MCEPSPNSASNLNGKSPCVFRVDLERFLRDPDSIGDVSQSGPYFQSGTRRDNQSI